MTQEWPLCEQGGDADLIPTMRRREDASSPLQRRNVAASQCHDIEDMSSRNDPPAASQCPPWWRRSVAVLEWFRLHLAHTEICFVSDWLAAASVLG